MKASLSIRHRLPLLICGLVCIVLGVNTGLVYMQTAHSDRIEVEERLQRMDRQIADFFATSSRRLRELAEALADEDAIHSWLRTRDPAAHERVVAGIRRLQQSGYLIADVEVWDSAGTPLLNALPGRIAASPETARELMGLVASSDRSAVSALGGTDDRPSYVVIAAVVEDGHILGYLVQRHTLASAAIWGLWEPRDLTESDARIIVGNTAGSGTWRELATGQPLLPAGAWLARGVVEYRRSGVGAMLGTALPIEDTPWTVAIEVPCSSALAAPRLLLWRLIAFDGLLLLIAAVAAWMLTLSLVRPLAALTRGAEAISKGDYSRRVTITRQDELGTLGNAFNRMGQNLFDVFGELETALKGLGVSEHRYRSLFDANPQAMWVFEIETLRFLAVNDAVVEHYGYSREEFLGMTIHAIRPPEDIPTLHRLLEEDRTVGNDRSHIVRHRKKDGTLIDVEIHSRGIVLDGRQARLVVAIDITARRQLEEQLRQSQKMEAIGRLAGGVAHDFNNLLTVILAECDLSLMERNIGGTAEGTSLEEIRKAAERAAQLTRQLLVFSRRHLTEPTALQMNDVVRDVDTMLRRLIGEDISLRIQLDDGLGRAVADRGQVEQVLINLAVNARDAMPEGGALQIETEQVDLDEAYAETHAGVIPGRYVMFAVSDTGCGMSEEVKAHIFEPFFTTKEQGKGTGLGLATCYGIVQQSHGHIGVYSEAGVGTTIRVYLPAADADAAEAERTEPRAMPGGQETILLVEDEAQVRQLAARILTSRGYTVLAAGSAEEALDILRATSRSIDLLLTDVVLPKMGGRALAEQACVLLPDLRVLFTSGYADDVILRNRLLDRGIALLHKPFTSKTLLRKVRDVLDRVSEISGPHRTRG